MNYEEIVHATKAKLCKQLDSIEKCPRMWGRNDDIEHQYALILDTYAMLCGAGENFAFGYFRRFRMEKKCGNLGFASKFEDTVGAAAAMMSELKVVRERVDSALAHLVSKL